MNLRAVFVRALAVFAAAVGVVHGQSAVGHSDWPGPGRLFVGTNYQPVDRSPEEIHRDIALMRQAGFSVVRMGDLSWDYFEPAEGRYDFAPFDAVMDEMAANGIKVILDIRRPACADLAASPVSRRDLVDQHGAKLYPPSATWTTSATRTTAARPGVATGCGAAMATSTR